MFNKKNPTKGRPFTVVPDIERRIYHYVFPKEKIMPAPGKIANIIKHLLYQLEGEIRPGTERTPERVERAWREMLDGYNVNIKDLFVKFDDDSADDQIVAMKNIKTWTVCEHHLLPVELCIHIAYLPSMGKVIGASKLERLANAFSHRLQLQERIAKQIADALMEHLNPRGVAVVIHGVHGCMRCRGVKSSSSEMVNSVMLGEFRENQNMRMEVLSLLGLRGS